MMRPVEYASPRVPFVFSIKIYPITFIERVDSVSQVDVVSDQYCLPRLQPNDEALVPTAVVVISEDLFNDAAALNLNVALMIGKRASQCLVATGYGFDNARSLRDDQIAFGDTEVDADQDDGDQNNFFHL